MSKPISQALLREILDYDPETGFLTWKHRATDLFAESDLQSQEQTAAAWNGRHAGKRAFTGLTAGYCVGKVFWRDYRAHRIIWAWWYGEWPTTGIDHINHDRTDNRIENLRLANDSVNMKNQIRHCTNKSGVTGVIWLSRTKRWHATIKAKGKSRHIGYFVELGDAAKARKAAEKLYGYHPNHGAEPVRIPGGKS